MIVVTGAAGFIGSCMIAKLNQEGFNAIVAVDKFDQPEKEHNLEGKKITARIDRDDFFEWLDANHEAVEFIFHLGARTDTAEFDIDLLRRLNTDYSKRIWSACVEHQLPLIYASSAATYGLGASGYADDEASINELQPLNAYGDSKNEFDKWVLQQSERPFYWAGLKFFNVYGPNEYHKSRMASVVFHAFNQIKQTGGMKLFRSHRADVADGEQCRDFIYVKDVTDVCYYLMRHRENSGIFNLGTGKSRTFVDLTRAVFAAMHIQGSIRFVDTPEDIRDKYQYFTEAQMEKLRAIGYDKEFSTLEAGVEDYVKHYLAEKKYL